MLPKSDAGGGLGGTLANTQTQSKLIFWDPIGTIYQIQNDYILNVEYKLLKFRNFLGYIGARIFVQIVQILYKFEKIFYCFDQNNIHSFKTVTSDF